MYFGFHYFLTRSLPQPPCGHPCYSLSHYPIRSPSNENPSHVLVLVVQNPLLIIVLFPMRSSCFCSCGVRSSAPLRHLLLLFATSCSFSPPPAPFRHLLLLFATSCSFSPPPAPLRHLLHNYVSRCIIGCLFAMISSFVPAVT